MPAFLSQRSLDSRFRGNDRLRRATASVIPTHPPSPPTGHSRLPPFPPTCHSRENGNPLRLHHSNSQTPIGHQEPKAARPMPAFLSQRSLDSRFRWNDGFWGATASVFTAYRHPHPSVIPPYRHPHPPVIPVKTGIHCAYIIPPEPVPDPNRGPRTQGRPSNASLPVAKVSRFPLSRE